MTINFRKVLSNFTVTIFTLTALLASHNIYSDDQISDFTEGELKAISFAKGYTYLEVVLKDGSLLNLATANVNSKLEVGSTLFWKNPRKASNYFSKSESKVYSELYIVELINDIQGSGTVLSTQTVAEDVFITVSREKKEQMLVIRKNLLVDELTSGQHIKWTFFPSETKDTSGITRIKSIEALRNKNK